MTDTFGSLIPTDLPAESAAALRNAIQVEAQALVLNEPTLRVKASLAAARALFRDGDTKAASAALAILDGQTLPPKRVARIAKLAEKIAFKDKALKMDASTTLLEILTNPPEEYGEKELRTSAMMQWLFDRRGDQSLSRAEFEDRAIWGYRSARAVLRQAKMLIAAGELGGFEGPLAELTPKLDTTCFTQALAEGRSSLIGTTHSGFIQAFAGQFKQIDAPSLRIGANRSRKSESDTTQFLSVAGEDIQNQFHKAVKFVRKTPSLIYVAIDGVYGSDLVDVDVLDIKIPMAQGAAVLSYYGKADTFFIEAHWTGEVFDHSITRGPIYDDAMSREDWTAEWFKFAAAQIEDTLTGPPENMRLFSGIWKSLSKQLGETA